MPHVPAIYIPQGIKKGGCHYSTYSVMARAEHLVGTGQGGLGHLKVGMSCPFRHSPRCFRVSALVVSL